MMRTDWDPPTFLIYLCDPMMSTHTRVSERCA
jgi:hypothetical protein